MHFGNRDSKHINIIARTIANAIIPIMVGIAGFKLSI